MNVTVLASQAEGAPDPTAFAAGWREAAPGDSVAVYEVAQSVERAFALGLPDAARLDAQAVLDHLASQGRILVGGREEFDFGRPVLEAAVARWGSLSAARAALGSFVFGADDEVALRGLNGASARRAALVGDDVALEAERAAGAFTARVEHELAPEDPVRLSLQPYSGAGGGLGFALLALGGRPVHVRELVFAHAGLDAVVPASDLVVVLLGEFGVQELFSSAVEAVSPRALAAAVPLVVACAENHTSRVQRAELGVQGTYEVTGSLHDVRAHARRIAHTWSR